MALKVVGIVIAVVVGGIGISWAVQGSNWFMYDVFAPKYEASKRKTFEESKAYHEGTVQELQNMQFEYIKADEGHKKALGDIILRRAADFPQDELPPDLKEFIDQLKKERMESN